MDESSPDTESDLISQKLTEAQVAQFLLDHPDFLYHNPHVYEALTLPKPNLGKNIANFQSYLIDRLRQDKSKALETARDVVETARHNMNNQSRIHQSVLKLLDCPSFEDFIECLTFDLSTVLDVDITSLVVEIEDDKIPHSTIPGVRIVPNGTIGQWMKHHTLLMQPDIGGLELIYGAGHTLVRSQLLLKINISPTTPPAILAFGSRNPQQFHAGQGSEQIMFLAKVIELLFKSWLNHHEY